MRFAALLLVAGSCAPNVPPGAGDGPPCQAHCDDDAQPGPLSLSVSVLGVALSSVPGRSVVTRTLAVTASRGVVVGWTAQADQPWLRVTPSGTTAGT